MSNYIPKLLTCYVRRQMLVKKLSSPRGRIGFLSLKKGEWFIVIVLIKDQKFAFCIEWNESKGTNTVGSRKSLAPCSSRDDLSKRQWKPQCFVASIVFPFCPVYHSSDFGLPILVLHRGACWGEWGGGISYCCHWLNQQVKGRRTVWLLVWYSLLQTTISNRDGVFQKLAAGRVTTCR